MNQCFVIVGINNFKIEKTTSAYMRKRDLCFALVTASSEQVFPLSWKVTDKIRRGALLERLQIWVQGALQSPEWEVKENLCRSFRRGDFSMEFEDLTWSTQSFTEHVAKLVQ